MMYPTNDQMPEQGPDLPLQPETPRFRERVVSWLRVKLGIADDREKVIVMRMGLYAALEVSNEALRAQDATIRGLTARLENLEKLAIETNRIVTFHHDVLQRWASQSATLRDIEDVHGKKLKRQQREFAGASERLAEVADAYVGEDGG